MRNKMRKDMIPETEEEKAIAEHLEALRNSDEVQNFSKKMQDIAQTNEVKRFRSRTKTTNSAIRTLRVRRAENLPVAQTDYCGYTFITEDETTIPEIVEQIKEILPNAEYLDFSKEDVLYSPIFKIKRCPPLAYSILAREKMEEQLECPIEIRVCTKEGFISEQAVYYTIYKNDELDIDWENKDKIRDISQHIMYKLALLDMRKDLSDEEKRRHTMELNKILENNRAYLARYNEIFESVIAEYGKSVYEFENFDRISNMNASLTEDQQDDAFDSMKNNYLTIFKSIQGLEFISRINTATKRMRTRDYTSFLEGTENNGGEEK